MTNTYDIVMYLSIAPSPKHQVRSDLEGSLGSSYPRYQDIVSGQPLPHEGRYWSASHSGGRYGAVIAPQLVGLDIELITPRSTIIYDQVVSTILPTAQGRIMNTYLESSEDNPHRALFYTLWTAKEAIIKMTGLSLDYHNDIICVDYIPKQHMIDTILFDGYLRMKYQKQLYTVSTGYVQGGYDTLSIAVTMNP